MTDTGKLSLGLDDIIHLNRMSNRRGSGGNPGFRGRPGRGNYGGGRPRAAKSGGGNRWQHDLYEGNTNRNRGNRATEKGSGVNSTTKLFISNLDFGVTNDDIQELFEEVGAVRSARIHFDETGRSLGTAEVIYERRVDAVTAQRKYNGLNLDERPMNIEIVGSTNDRSAPVSNRFTFGRGRGGGQNRQNGNRNNNTNNFQGNRARGGKQRQANRNENTQLTVEDLDAELDAYRTEGKANK